MKRTDKPPKKKIGRPKLNVVRLGTSITESDRDFLKSYGYGSVSLGIRLAAREARRREEGQG